MHKGDCRLRECFRLRQSEKRREVVRMLSRPDNVVVVDGTAQPGEGVAQTASQLRPVLGEAGAPAVRAGWGAEEPRKREPGRGLSE